MTASLALWAAADLTWTLHYNHLDDAPYPNFGGRPLPRVLPLGYVGVVLLLRARLRPVRASLWLDGAVSGLTLAALTTALLFGPILAATEGSPSAVAVTLAYPVGDLLLLCSVGVALTITGWRPGRAWGLIALSLVLTALGDVIYSYMENTGAYAAGRCSTPSGRRASSPWPRPPGSRSRRGAVRADGLAVLIPAGFAVLALGLLVYGWVADLPPLAGALAAAGLLAAMARGGLDLPRERPACCVTAASRR